MIKNLYAWSPDVREKDAGFWGASSYQGSGDDTRPYYQISAQMPDYRQEIEARISSPIVMEQPKITRCPRCKGAPRECWKRALKSR